MLAHLATPMYNTASERAFGMVNNIETDFLNELAQRTACALFCVKANNDVRPSLFVPNVKELYNRVRAYFVRANIVCVLWPSSHSSRDDRLTSIHNDH